MTYYIIIYQFENVRDLYVHVETPLRFKNKCLEQVSDKKNLRVIE